MTPKRYDIAIIGGGPIGAALALALPSKGLRICVLANNEPQNKALRPIALSHGSQLLLERLGLWHALSPQTTKILNIHISEQHALATSPSKRKNFNCPHWVTYWIILYCPNALASQRKRLTLTFV